MIVIILIILIIFIVILILIMLIIIRYRSDDMESDLREAFKIFDRDKDGFVDISEFKQVDPHPHQSVKQVKPMCKQSCCKFSTSLNV